MKFLTAVLFLMPILYGYKCAPIENQMQEWQNAMQGYQNYAEKLRGESEHKRNQIIQESEKSRREQIENAGKLREESEHERNQIIQESEKYRHEQIENAEKLRAEWEHKRNQMLQNMTQQIRDSMNVIITGNGANSDTIILDTTSTDNIDSNGDRVYNYVQTTRTNNIERQTRKRWNPVSKEIETSHYVRDWTKANSEFVLENN